MNVARKPEFVHALMKILQEADLRFLDQFDEMRLWTDESIVMTMLRTFIPKASRARRLMFRVKPLTDGVERKARNSNWSALR